MFGPSISALVSTQAVLNLAVPVAFCVALLAMLSGSDTYPALVPLTSSANGGDHERDQPELAASTGRTGSTHAATTATSRTGARTRTERTGVVWRAFTGEAPSCGATSV